MQSLSSLKTPVVEKKRKEEKRREKKTGSAGERQETSSGMETRDEEPVWSLPSLNINTDEERDLVLL